MSIVGMVIIKRRMMKEVMIWTTTYRLNVSMFSVGLRQEQRLSFKRRSARWRECCFAPHDRFNGFQLYSI